MSFLGAKRIFFPTWQALCKHFSEDVIKTIILQLSSAKIVKIRDKTRVKQSKIFTPAFQ